MYNESQNITETSVQEDIVPIYNANCSRCTKPSEKLWILDPETGKYICFSCSTKPKAEEVKSSRPSKKKKAPVQASVRPNKPRKLRLLKRGREEGCVHFWNIESPNGSISPGTCTKCGEIREFFNSFTHTWWDKPKPKKKSKLSGV